MALTAVRLVVNADDAGIAAATDDAILRCARAGVLRAATVVAGGPTAARFLELAAALDLDIGWHCNLTWGRPLCGAATSLCRADGTFLPKAELWRRGLADDLHARELERELQAQCRWFAEHGCDPTHVDGHNHVHLLPPVAAALGPLVGGRFVRRVRLSRRSLLPFAELAEVADGALPGRHTRQFAGFAFSSAPTRATFLDELATASGTVEFMVHPGARPGSAFTGAAARDQETATLCDPALATALTTRGIASCTFRELS